MSANILIIEDNPANLELMKYLLQTYGCRTATAVNGLQGAELIETGSFDLVVCDISLPGLDGYQILARVRQNPALAHVPLVAVTAFAMEEDRQKILKAGFDAYLSKPITPQTFVADVLQYLDTRASTQKPP